ncbi:STAS domain-containing protein [Nonomuraea sp. NPDC050663]|uniref:STAS domain-containing protein n=1 Tax=Nonomuraea sp. NPDC050663 TaxID=3364370 RepID=UPI0037A735B8
MKNDPLQVLVRSEGPWTVAEVVGELSYANAARLRAALAAVWELPRPQQLVLELSQVGACDSGGMAAVLALFRRVTVRGGSLVLVGTHGPMLELLKRTRTSALMPMYDTLSQVPALPSNGGPRLTPQPA